MLKQLIALWYPRTCIFNFHLQRFLFAIFLRCYNKIFLHAHKKVKRMHGMTTFSQISVFKKGFFQELTVLSLFTSLKHLFKQNILITGTRNNPTKLKVFVSFSFFLILSYLLNKCFSHSIGSSDILRIAFRTKLLCSEIIDVKALCKKIEVPENQND